MQFKTQQLVKSGFDWTGVYPTEQGEMKSALNYNFNLTDIQAFLRKQSNNFENSTAELYDLDRYLYGIYEKWGGKKEPKPAPEPAPAPSGEPAPSGGAPTLAELEKSLKIIMLGLKKNPKDANMKMRKKIIEVGMKNAGKKESGGLMKSGGGVGNPSVSEIEGGDEIESFIVDESMSVPNAGDAVIYNYDGKKYMITTWNTEAEEHEDGEKTVSELPDDDDEEHDEDDPSEFARGGIVPKGYFKKSELVWREVDVDKGSAQGITDWWAKEGERFNMLREDDPSIFVEYVSPSKIKVYIPDPQNELDDYSMDDAVTSVVDGYGGYGGGGETSAKGGGVKKQSKKKSGKGIIKRGKRMDKNKKAEYESRYCETGMESESLLFPIDKFDKVSAKKWATDHGFRAGSVDVSKTRIRIRQIKDMSLLKRDSFRTIPFGDSGIQAVVACRK